MRMVEINIPFMGFYNSWYSEEIDRQESDHIEHHINDSYGSEAEHPEPLRLNEYEMADIFYRHSSYDIAYRNIARAYVESFSSIVSEGLGFDLGLVFKDMTSPREYNFQTDRLFADIPFKVIARLFAMSKRDEHKTLESVISERFTSCSGFISFYSNDLETRLDKPLLDWDHNEYCALLEACIELAGLDMRDDIDWPIYCSLSEGNVFDCAWQDCVNWESVDKDIEELRTEKLAAFKEENGENAPEEWHYFSRDPNQLALPLYT